MQERVKKVSGKLKTHEHEIIRLSDETLLAHKSAAVKAVEQLIGLSLSNLRVQYYSLSMSLPHS
ncbi:hypothetical protein D9981_14190 [Pseudoalteromonas phenolica O-BC30]|nr:hypothetical protein D9981_14190 [Pseudoalteromonas phenolica O-BC30]